MKNYFKTICLCIFFIVKSQSLLFAQNTLDNVGLNSTTTASVAYSMRKLSSSYSGYAIQVRRTSDNATLDIGFTGGGDLDTTALTTFVGSNSGYVSIWYDQSGNGRNLTQATTSEQPRIVSAGTIEVENTKPFIRFFKTSVNCLKLAAEMTTTGHVAVVNKFASGGGGFILGHSSTYYWHSNPASYLFHNISSSSVYNSKVWQNGSNVSAATAVWNTTLMVNSIAPQTPNSNTNWDNIGRDRSIYNHISLGGGYAELIVFSTAINSLARITLEKNQGSYYGITVADNYLNKYGQVSSSSSDNINRNGALGISGIMKNGETIARTALSSIVTAPLSSIASSTAASGVTIESDAGGTLTAGVCWSTSTSPTTSNFKTIDGGTAGTYISNLTNLTGNTTYYVRAYATNGIGTVYGSEQSFTTLPPEVPTLDATTAASSITGISATCGGNVTNDGGSTVTARGVCWSTVSDPTISDSKTTDAGTTGSFSSSITSLSLGTLYYVRAYATNSVGTAYGSQITLTSLNIPTLEATVEASAITSVSASSGSTITADGGASVTARGVCWSTSTAPTIALSTKTTDASGIGSFTSSIDALAANTTYYVRAYATNSVGTTYGSEISFMTQAPVLPTLSATTVASSIRSTAAVSGSTVISDGGAAITVGVCWSTSTNPTIADGVSSAVGALGVYTSSLTGLTLGNTYYVRAYATNSVGTVYGSEISFTTAYGVGESYQGGIIAYIFVSGDTGYVSGELHGLIAAATNQSTGTVWGCFNSALAGADGTAIGTGNQNTIDIMAACSTVGIPAKLCGDLSLNGYTDWYLPSKDEIAKLYLNRSAIGGFANAYYWSSSEYSGTIAWVQHFSTGLLTNTRSKNSSYYVRAVRSF